MSIRDVVLVSTEQLLLNLGGYRVVQCFLYMFRVINKRAGENYNYLLLAVSTRPPDGVLLPPAALAARRLASLREL